MAAEPKRKARGIVVVVEAPGHRSDFYHVGPLKQHRYSYMDSDVLVCKKWLHRAGCPRLKPGEVKKVRVIIEEA